MRQNYEIIVLEDAKATLRNLLKIREGEQFLYEGETEEDYILRAIDDIETVLGKMGG